VRASSCGWWSMGSAHRSSAERPYITPFTVKDRLRAVFDSSSRRSKPGRELVGRMTGRGKLVGSERGPTPAERVAELPRPPGNARRAPAWRLVRIPATGSGRLPGGEPLASTSRASVDVSPDSGRPPRSARAGGRRAGVLAFVSLPRRLPLEESSRRGGVRAEMGGTPWAARAATACRAYCPVRSLWCPAEEKEDGPCGGFPAL
jgi:hypothetical protein